MAPCTKRLSSSTDNSSTRAVNGVSGSIKSVSSTHSSPKVQKIKLYFGSQRRAQSMVLKSGKILLPPRPAAPSPPTNCPFEVLGLRRNEFRSATGSELIEEVFDVIAKSKTPPFRPMSEISRAAHFLSNDRNRLKHEASARKRQCSCMTAWERLSDPQQAYLTKHSDGTCHRVPEPCNPAYNNLDKDLPDIDYGDEWCNKMAIKDRYNRIWEKFDCKREDDDEIPPCDCRNCNPMFG